MESLTSPVKAIADSEDNDQLNVMRWLFEFNPESVEVQLQPFGDLIVAVLGQSETTEKKALDLFISLAEKTTEVPGASGR